MKAYTMDQEEDDRFPQLIQNLGQNGSKFLRLRKPERQEVSKIDGTDS
jgi:hypothetical protein